MALAALFNSMVYNHFMEGLLKYAAVEHTPNGPLNIASGDVYFSPQGGKEETHHVFLDGVLFNERVAQLPANSVYTIAELGFGTGLNMWVAWEEFLKVAHSQARLHWVSFELTPLHSCDMRQALAQADIPAAWVEAVLAQLPEYPITGWHRCVLFAGRLILDLWYGDAREGIRQLVFPAGKGVDAWFLDGFAPRVNPEMWSDEIWSQMAELSVPGCMMATFSVAGVVRRGLVDARCEWFRRDGFGRKRESLAGAWQGEWQPFVFTALDKPVRIIGAGLAGSATAYVLKQYGYTCEIWDKHGVATQSSGNPQALVQPRMTAPAHSGGQIGRQAWIIAKRELLDLKLYQQAMSWHLVWDEKSQRRLGKQIEALQWPEAWVKWVDSEVLPEPFSSLPLHGAMCFPAAGWVRPVDVVTAMIHRAQAAFVQREWNPIDSEGFVTILATGKELLQHSKYLAEKGYVSRGQLLRVQTNLPKDLIVHSKGIYAVQDSNAPWMTLGATKQMGNTDGAWSAEDTDELIGRWQIIAPCPIEMSTETIEGRVAFRTHHKTGLPYIGHDGQHWHIGALGARGVTHAFIAAHGLVAQMLGLPDIYFNKS